MKYLPRDVYEALHFSALAFDGIGKHQLYNEFGQAVSGPCCAHGHAAMAETPEGAPYVTTSNEIDDALFNAGITASENDAIFGLTEDRITFETWCERLGVVPNDEPWGVEVDALQDADADAELGV